MTKIIKRFAVLVVSLGFCVLAAEAGLRLYESYTAGRNPDRSLRSEHLRILADDFWTYKPDSRGVYSGVLFRMNSLGLRGEEPAENPRKPRIVCVGNSCTFGYSLKEEDSYPMQLFALMKENGTAGDVINAGVEGYTSHQALRFFRRFAPELKPDILIVQLGNNEGRMAVRSDRNEGFGSILLLRRFLSNVRLWQKTVDTIDRYRLFLRRSILVPRVSPREFEQDLMTLCLEAGVFGCRVILLCWDSNPSTRTGFERGKMLYEKGEYKKALPLFAEAASVRYNRDPAPLRYLSLCYEHLGMQKESDRIYQQALAVEGEGHSLPVGLYIEKVKAVAEKQGVETVIFEGDMLKKEYFRDICHPTPQFNKVIAERLYDLIADDQSTLRFSSKE